MVTGASAGIGEAFARAYAARGFDVALVARRAERLQALAEELKARHGVQTLVIPADLAIWEAHVPVLEAVAKTGRQVDVLVNNAGFGVPQTFVGVPWERQRDFLMTLVVSACGLSYGVIPGMKARGWGRIVNVASLVAFAPGAAGYTLYPAAKSFAVKFSQSLDAEFRDQGIKVTAICPGFTKTEFAAASGAQALMDQAPRRFWQTSTQVAEIAIAANEAGRVVVVPGWHNKLAAAVLKVLPDALLSALIRRGAARYRLED
ncbi:MAG TPA: SDR family NAD(P)-dependent oxidoreductase [Caulobacteraceae bacterium]|nr:SDR family NAD(P)-dependent oxidoreductase [Caulobacteraceae bacterium]